MATEDGMAAARQRARNEMATQGLNQRSLATSAKVDPNTISDFLAGRRWPIMSTLAKIETALGLTHGTLAAIGEEEDSQVGRDRARRKREVQQLDDPYLTEASDAQLLAELAWRMEDLRRNQIVEPEIEPAPYVPSRYGGAPDDDPMYDRYMAHEGAVSRAAHHGITREEYERENPAPRIWVREVRLDARGRPILEHVPDESGAAKDVIDPAARTLAQLRTERDHHRAIVDQAADSRPNQGRTLREHLDNLTDD